MKALQYLDKAVSRVTPFGITDKAESLPVQNLIARVAHFGSDEAKAIAFVLARQGLFNELARSEMAGMDVANRHEKMAAEFNTIREDAGVRLKYAEAGKVTPFQNLHVRWRDFRRGTIPQRFNNIKKTYLAVSEALDGQLKRESAILEAYADYRFAMKDAETQAHSMLEKATAFLESAKLELANAQKELDEKTASGVSGKELSQLEMVRDEKTRAFTVADEQYQVTKDLADQLRVAYHASEFVFARLKQVNNVKKRLYEQGIAFFSTNEIVFTGLAANYTSMVGLHEGTQAINTLEDITRKGIEDLTNTGTKVLEDGLRAGYSAGIKADDMRKLVDAVCSFQENSVKMIAELRHEATENAAEVARISEEGKRRFAEIVTKQAVAV